jgi:endonuclease/exonuclease/phosphatase (EEP) superfamily protein YafD
MVCPVRSRASNVVALLCVPAFAAALAPFVAPWHWTLDLLACFPLQAVFALAVAAASLLAARRPRLALLYLAGAALAAVHVVPLGAPALLASPDAVPLRVLTLNLLRGNEANAQAALDVVAARDPDVVVASEVTPTWLAALRDGMPHHPFVCERADAGFFGVAVLSRLPLRDAAVIPLGTSFAPAVRAVVETKAGPVGMLAVHAPRPGGPQRNRERDQALAAIPAALAGLPWARIVVGDFNATPWNPAFGDALAETGMARAGTAPWLTTWPARFPWPLRLPIDHVLIGDGVAVDSVEAGPSFGSDHLPLFAALRVRRARERGGAGAGGG